MIVILPKFLNFSLGVKYSDYLIKFFLCKKEKNFKRLFVFLEVKLPEVNLGSVEFRTKFKVKAFLCDM